jgi:hypothetical protein
MIWRVEKNGLLWLENKPSAEINPNANRANPVRLRFRWGVGEGFFEFDFEEDFAMIGCPASLSEL